MRNRYITLLMLILSSTFASVTMAEETLNASVDRAWGLLLGDDVNVKIDLKALEVGIDESSLPQKDKRYGTWLYLKTIDTGTDALVFHYQVVNVPVKNTAIETPTFDVKQQNE
ncbi:MAG: hypothetical protein JKY63_01265 [Rhodobiaceae bacterium]|nr:hypothetical protein [Rhodobiaceae bacterium]